jgi:TIR domain/Protein of unknown function (DUF1566)
MPEKEVPHWQAMEVLMSYEVFLSYARRDNDDGWTDEFRRALAAIYEKLTGAAVSIFFDTEAVGIGSIWEAKILQSLRDSEVLVAVLSPSYVRSEWCRREWREFVDRERVLQQKGILSSDQELIFPILLFPFERGDFSPAEAAFIEEIKERQWLDVSSRSDGTPLRADQVRGVAEGLIDMVFALRTGKRAKDRGSAAVALPVTLTILDSSTGLEWAGRLSPENLSIDEARDYVGSLPADSSGPWRLPTEDELRSIIDEEALVPEDSDTDPFPLREPFNGQRFGYLFSGDVVPGYDKDSVYIMNIRNGHIFNGQGYSGYVRAVRTRASPTLIASSPATENLVTTD